MKRILLACVLLLVASAAIAQGRIFPENAPRGYLSPIPGMGERMMLNGKEIVLSTGIQIRNQANIIIFSTMVKPDSIVKYQLDGNYLHRAWIMTPYEIAKPDKYKLPIRETGDDAPMPLPTPKEEEDKKLDDKKER